MTPECTQLDLTLADIQAGKLFDQLAPIAADNGGEIQSVIFGYSTESEYWRDCTAHYIYAAGCIQVSLEVELYRDDTLREVREKYAAALRQLADAIDETVPAELAR